MTSVFQKALSALRSGRVIAHATETCYGFACDVFSQSALKRLYALKKMPRTKPVSILVRDLKSAKKYGVFNDAALLLAKKHWPGPLTIIVKRKKTLPVFLNPGRKTIGIRVPGHALSRKLAQRLGRPIITTSANISGFSPPYSVSAIRRQFVHLKLKPDFMLNSGRLPRRPPSTIIDVSQSKTRIIRQGSVELQKPSH